jgi:hypothetical protein
MLSPQYFRGAFANDDAGSHSIAGCYAGHDRCVSYAKVLTGSRQSEAHNESGMILRAHLKCFFANYTKPATGVEIHCVLIDFLDPKKELSDSSLTRMGQNLIQQA